MQATLFQLQEAGLTRHEIDNFQELERVQNGTYWLELIGPDRAGLLDFLTRINLVQKPFPERLLKPGSRRFYFGSGTQQMDLPIMLNDAEGSVRYVTFLISRSGIVTLSDFNVDLISHLEDELDRRRLDENPNRIMMACLLIKALFNLHADYVQQVRKEINSLNFLLDDAPEEVDRTNILQAKHRVLQLSGVLEEQYSVLGGIPTFDHLNLDNGDQLNLFLKELTQNLDYLIKSMDRAEERLAAVRVHYALHIDEKSQRRLNLLTIIQSIFVPISFLAGLYGMNFVNMPELQWEYSYFLLLLFMVTTSGITIWYFWREGWFS